MMVMVLLLVATSVFKIIIVGVVGHGFHVRYIHIALAMDIYVLVLMEGKHDVYTSTIIVI